MNKMMLGSEISHFSVLVRTRERERERERKKERKKKKGEIKTLFGSSAGRWNSIFR